MLQFNGGSYAQKARWQYFLLLFALLPALLVLNSCGSSTPAAVPTISASCSNTSVNAAGSSVCSAVISNLSSTLVTWQVNGVTGGSATYGTIDVNGNYVAPAVQPTGALNIVTITAIAQAQSSLTATVSITILPPAAISAITCLNQNNQSTQTVAPGPGNSLTCTPTVAGGGNIAVFWYVNNSASCSATLGFSNGAVPVNGVSTYPYGKITTAGQYQMNFQGPQIPPPGGTVAITAVSQVDSTETLCLTLTLTLGTDSLQGAYAFSTSGRIVSGNTVRGRVGSFTAANGQIIGGFEDINPQPGTIATTPIPFSGNYSIGPDGRGTMAFCEGSSSNSCSTSGETSQFRIVIDSAQTAQMIEFSSPSSNVALTAASGEMDLQPDSSSFNDAGLTGTYSFIGSGYSFSPTAAESVAGVFSTNGSGLVTSGEVDINNLGGQSILTGSTYSVSANGRGTATLVTPSGTFSFVFYMVSSSRAKFMETDPSAILVGDDFKQQSIVSWPTSVLSGTYVFQTAGMGASGEVTDLVSFTSPGTGTLTPGSVTIDDNNAGTVTSTPSLSGTYTISGNGRGTLTIPGHTYVFYMVSTSQAVIQETTSGIVGHGSLVQLAAGPFSLTSVEFSYALNLSGTDGSGNEEDFLGQLTTNGIGSVTGGSLDVNDIGATKTGVSTFGTYIINVTSGRIGMALTQTIPQPQNLVMYLISPTQAFAMVGMDSNHTVASGSLYNQY